MGSMEEEPTLRDPAPDDRQFTDTELQVLAMARSLAPQFMPVLAVAATLARSGTPEQRQSFLGDVGAMADPRRLPCDDILETRRTRYREAGWQDVFAFARAVAEGRENCPLFRVAAAAWRQACTGNANVTPDAPSLPMPLRQAEARELLTLTAEALASLLSFPSPRVRAWAVLNAGQLVGHHGPSSPEIGPQAGD